MEILPVCVFLTVTVWLANSQTTTEVQTESRLLVVVEQSQRALERR